jgi:hypothetical protein
VVSGTNTWLAENAARISSHAGAGTAGSSYRPVPLPPVVDLSQSLRPQQRQPQQPQVPTVTATMGEFGAAVVVTAGGLRADPGLEVCLDRPAGAESADSSAASSPVVSGMAQGERWAQLPASANGSRGASTAAANGRTSRPSLEVPVNNDAASGQNLSHQQSGVTSSSSLRSPGGVSLHARTPGPLRQPLAAMFGGPSSSSSSFRAEGDDAAIASSSSDTASPAPPLMPRSALRNQIVPVDADALAGSHAGLASMPGQHNLNDRTQVLSHLAPQPAGANAAAALGEEVPCAGQQDGEECDAAAGRGRLPTLSGRVAMHHLQPMDPGSPRGQ